jgi:hypothetical protein
MEWRSFCGESDQNVRPASPNGHLAIMIASMTKSAARTERLSFTNPLRHLINNGIRLPINDIIARSEPFLLKQ